MIESTVAVEQFEKLKHNLLSQCEIIGMSSVVLLSQLEKENLFPELMKAVREALLQNHNKTGVTLSSREMEIMVLACRGKLNKEIADICGITSNTVKNHLTRIYRKFGVRNRQEAIFKMKLGIQ